MGNVSQLPPLVAAWSPDFLWVGGRIFNYEDAILIGAFNLATFTLLERR